MRKPNDTQSKTVFDDTSQNGPQTLQIFTLLSKFEAGRSGFYPSLIVSQNLENTPVITPSNMLTSDFGRPAFGVMLHTYVRCLPKGRRRMLSRSRS